LAVLACFPISIFSLSLFSRRCVSLPFAASLMSIPFPAISFFYGFTYLAAWSQVNVSLGSPEFPFSAFDFPGTLLKDPPFLTAACLDVVFHSDVSAFLPPGIQRSPLLRLFFCQLPAHLLGFIFFLKAAFSPPCGL